LTDAATDGQEELSGDERRYRDVLRISGDALWELDANNRYSYISDNVMQANNWRSGDIIGKPLSGVGGEAVGDVSWDDLTSMLARREHIINLDFAIDRAEVGRKVFRITAEPQYDEAGAYTGYIGLSRDVTAAVDEITESRQRFHDIAQAASDWFWEMDADLRFSYISDLVSDVAGISVNEVIGRRREELLGEVREADALARHLEDLEAHRAFRDFVYSVERADGTTYWASTSGVPVFSEDGAFQGYRGAARDITAIVEAEERADKAHALLLDAIEYSPDGIMLWDADERFVAGNADKHERIPAELVNLLEPGRKFEDFTRAVIDSGFIVEATGREEAWLAERMQHFREQDHEVFVQQRADGTWVRISENRTRDGGILVTYTDITEIKQSEDAQRAAETQLIEAIEALDQGFALFDRDDCFVLCNSLYRNSFPPNFQFLERGVQFETIIREAARQSLYDNSETFFEQRLAQHRNPGTPIEINLAANAPSSHVYAKGATLLLTDRRTQEGGTVSTWMNITEQKRRDEALALSESRFSMAFESSPALLAISKLSDGTFIDVNAQWLKTLGYRKDEVIGKTAHGLRIWSDHADRDAVIETLAQEGSVQHLDTTLRRKDGTTVELLSSFDVIEFEGDKQMMYAGTDYAERKQMENALRLAKSEAEFASRTKSEFLANMSHELRTPLNAIIGFAEFIERQLHGPVGDARYLEYLHDIHDSGIHLLNLINDILDVSKVEAGKMDLRETAFDISQLIEGSLRLVQDRALEAGVKLSSGSDERISDFIGDETRIKQVMVNLLSNAVKFTPRAGEVHVSSSLDPDSGGIVVVVTDTGIGIAAEDFENVLRVFGQVDSRINREYEGAGLGLPLTKALVELHDGVLGLESTVGQGTTFTITFPPERTVGLAPSPD